MKILFRLFFLISTLLAVASFFLICGCDSGENAIDELTGKRAVKQFQKTKKDIEKIADKQEERYNKIPDDDEK
ncbi:hypothetical protein ACFL2O_01205 [Thermodesulfobacteriota bacterium]